MEYMIMQDPIVVIGFDGDEEELVVSIADDVELECANMLLEEALANLKQMQEVQ